MTFKEGGKRQTLFLKHLICLTLTFSSHWKECVRKFPLPLAGLEKPLESEKFVLSSPSTSPADQLKVMVTLSGDAISHADIALKLPRPGAKDLYHNTQAGLPLWSPF